MKTEIRKSPVKGGWLARNAVSGRFLMVGSASGVTKASPKSEAVVKDVSSRRSAALERLKNR